MAWEKDSLRLPEHQEKSGHSVALAQEDSIFTGLSSLGPIWVTPTMLHHDGRFVVNPLSWSLRSMGQFSPFYSRGR